MDKALIQIHRELQRLLGLHRQLLELLRSEREALVSADVEAIEARALEKQALLDEIARADEARRQAVLLVATTLGGTETTYTLSRLAIIAQGIDLKLGEQLRSVQQALSYTLTRIEEQGAYNRALVERSLEAVMQMKRNIVGGEAPHAATYSATGQKTNQAAGARLFSREA